MRTRDGRPGAALLALAAILAITAAWWALALWPAGAVQPGWLARTRAACFGAMPGGLPDAGGWIMLIGEPIGMIGVLVVVWGSSLRRDLRRLGAHVAGRAASAAVAVLVVATVATVALRVARAASFDPGGGAAGQGYATRADLAPPSATFTDQNARPFTFAELRGTPTLLTFAYGHCTTVCPATVQNLRIARQRAGRPDVPLVVLTVDPWRDTPERLPTIAGHWGLAPGDRVLSGDTIAVERALDELGIGRQRDAITGDVAHATTTMIVDGSGRIVWRVDGGWERLEQLLADLR